jgi:hypothetical protein
MALEILMDGIRSVDPGLHHSEIIPSQDEPVVDCIFDEFQNPLEFPFVLYRTARDSTST